MLKKCESLAVAEAIIGLTIERVNSMNKFKNMDATVECFDNCREQGLVIINYIKTDTQRIAVSRNRNSDDIVVYIYKKTGWNNLPAENEWDNRKFFKYNEYHEAMNYIVDNLIVDEEGKEKLIKNIPYMVKCKKCGKWSLKDKILYLACPYRGYLKKPKKHI